MTKNVIRLRARSDCVAARIRGASAVGWSPPSALGPTEVGDAGRCAALTAVRRRGAASSRSCSLRAVSKR